VLATFASYSQVYRNDFVAYNDYAFITGNNYVRAGLTQSGVKWAFFELYADYWHPLTWLSHMLDVEVFGLWAAGHHLVNLGLHILNTLLLFGLLHHTTRRLWPSALVAALFAVHPLHVESVAWAAERKDVLSTFFWFATLWAYVHYTRRPTAWRYAVVVVCFALGLLSKPMLVTLPVMLFLLDYWPLERFAVSRWRVSTPAGLTIGRLVMEKVPLAVMAAAVAGLTIMGQKETAMASLQAVGWPMRVTNAVISYGAYISQMVWPVNLAVFYPYPPRPQYFEAGVWLTLLASVTVAVIRAGKLHRYMLTGWLWYLLTLLPVIGLVQSGEQSRADRYTYVPLIGLFIMIAWAGSDLLRRRPRLRTAAITAAGAVLLGCGIVTWRTVGYWRDAETLFERAVSVTTDNTKAQTFLAGVLVKKGQVAKAMEILSTVAQRVPRDPDVLCSIGAAMTAQGQPDEALKWYMKALDIDPQLQGAQCETALTLVALGRYDEAEAYLRRAASSPRHGGQASAYLGLVLLKKGQATEALEAARKAIKLDPDIAVAHSVAAKALMSMGRMEEALVDLAVCNRLKPAAPTMTDYGSCLTYLGRPDEAEKTLRKAIEVDPGYAMAHYNLGVTLQQLGRTDEAIAEVRRAAELDPQNTRTRDYLKLLTGQ
jgi:tetratricopeptide (TPR) repeat protein